MIVIVILLVLLLIAAVFALGLGFLRNRKIQKQIEKGELTEYPSIKQVQDMECCGQHETCERDSLLAAVSKQIEYYNDEELDRFQGRLSDEYSENEIDEFREILYTMQEVEVAGWVRSLQLRAVELPDELKDEVFLIVGERRMNS
ncbi:MAG: phospholipase [Bacteroidaceae bacterium]|nr:phospholipase [Bacteroidaceae bacterium]